MDLEECIGKPLCLSSPTFSNPKQHDIDDVDNIQ